MKSFKQYLIPSLIASLFMSTYAIIDGIFIGYNLNDIVNVTVKKFMPFGAFAELEEGIEGLVHISQICDERIAKPEDKLELNQKVDAKIVGMDLENKKIELSIREVNGTNINDELKNVDGVTFSSEE